MKTVFENGEIVGFGWLPLIALCITVSGFIIFFENCRPFTRFRKILFGATVFVVVVVLYLTPEFFIVSGTDMLAETGGIGKMFPYIFSHMENNVRLEFYRTMSMEQVIFLGVYTLLAYPSYRLLIKPIDKFVEGLLFKNRTFEDDE